MHPANYQSNSRNPEQFLMMNSWKHLLYFFDLALLQKTLYALRARYFWRLIMILQNKGLSVTWKKIVTLQVWTPVTQQKQRMYGESAEQS